MTRSNSHIVKWMIAAGLALAAIASVLVATTRADSAAVQPAPSAFPVADVSSAQVADRFASFRSNFALLRSAPDAVAATSIILDPEIDRAEGRVVTLASAAALAQSGATRPAAALWVAPRSDGTQCLLAQPPDAQGPAQVCFTPEQAMGGYSLMTRRTSRS